MNSAYWIIPLTAAALIALILLLSIRRSRRTSQTLAQLIPQLRLMTKGDLDVRVATSTIQDRKFVELAEEINLLASRAKADLADMRRLERVRSEFLGNVSHELRTPMFTVQGFLETLLDGAVDDESVRRDFLQKAHHNVMRLHTLLNDLIEISRIESGEMKMSLRYFDAIEFFRNVVDEMRPTAEIAGIKLTFVSTVGDGSDAMVYGDRDRLKQAIVNLIENAIKYNRQEGSVVITVTLASDYADVRVQDTGIGIPEEDIDRIFERFYRVSKDRSREVGGSGLGLAIVKHIIEAHGTSINVSSVFGKGSTFHFKLKR